MDKQDKELLDRFASSPRANSIAISYGGDGELLRTVSQVGNSKGIVPIRDYGRCPKHVDLLREFVEDVDCKDSGNSLQLAYSKHPFIDYSLNGESRLFLNQKVAPISEIVWKSADPTLAMRFSVYVNGKVYMKQCIADGVVFATSLGSHGYFKSVARTMFNDSSLCGIGFIAPTYGICNLVLKCEDKVKIVLERSIDATISGDKCFKELESREGDSLDLQLSVEGVALYGYGIFCCPECRKLRNSTLVNDQYAI